MLLTAFPPKASQYAHAALQETAGGTLVWGTINPPTLINPVLTSHSVSSSLLSLLFDALVRIDSSGAVIPGVATWSVSDDGLTYRFYLKQRIRFHDGVELTSQDIKFTYQAIDDPLNQSHWRTNTDMVKQWNIIDRYTIEAILLHPTPNFLSKLVREILPAHLYEGKSLINHPQNFAPIGTGPFKLHSWDKKSNEIVLSANDQYFEGRPHLDKIIVRTFSNNAALWAGLMRGEVNFVKFLNQKDYKVLKQDPSFKTYQIYNGFNFAIVYNMHDQILMDQAMRSALNLAIDRKMLMQTVGMDGIESNGPFYPQSPWFSNRVMPPAYDPQKAISMLNKLGWNRTEAGGVLSKNGRPLVLTMLVDRNRLFYIQMAKVLRQQFSEIGVGLKVVFYDDESQLTKDYLDQIKPQMWLRMFLGNNSDPSDLVGSWYSASSEFGRLWAYESPAFDKLFQQGLVASKSERENIYQKIHELIAHDQPACFLFFSTTFHAVTADVMNTEEFFSPFMPGEAIKNWYISTERR